jgi:hypothetical protein
MQQHAEGDEMKDYRIEIKVRNNLLLSRIEACGYDSVLDFSQKTGIPYGTLARYCSLKGAPIGVNGFYKRYVAQIVDALHCSVEDIFPAAHLRIPMRKTRATLLADAIDVQQISHSIRSLAASPENAFLAKEISSALNNAVDDLTERERDIIIKRFGLNGEAEHTLEDVAASYKCTRENIRKIENDALRKLRHPARTKNLRGYLEEIGQMDLAQNSMKI